MVVPPHREKKNVSPIDKIIIIIIRIVCIVYIYSQITVYDGILTNFGGELRVYILYTVGNIEISRKDNSAGSDIYHGTSVLIVMRNRYNHHGQCCTQS